MKKNIFTILLALALVLSCVFVAAPDAHAAEAHSHCYCVNAEHVPETHVCEENVVWEPYEKGMTLVDGGHYYLVDSSSAEKRELVDAENPLHITICLNGQTFRAQFPFKVANGNTLTICDCKGTGAIRSSKTDATGYSVWVGKNGVVNFYGGILSGMTSTGKYARPVVVDGGTFNMYGGTIKNGDSGTITTGTPNLGSGGNVPIKN